MKRTVQMIICVILSAALLGSTVCYAAGSSGGPVYVSLGDSIADGIGLPANPLRGPDQVDKTLVYCNKTAGAYPVLTAQRLGISDSDFYQLACAGMRTVELRYCLDQSYVMPNQDANNFQGDELQTWVLSRFNYVELVSKADIITMNMCANDIATCALFAVRSAMASEGVSSVKLNALTESELAANEYFGALGKLLNYASQLDSYSRIAAAAVQGIYEGYTRWTENWNAICKRIYELNPDVMLVCLGMYNPFNEMKLSDDSLLKIGAALDGVVVTIDAFAAGGSPYASRYTYVSIMGIESMFGEQGKTFTDEDLLQNLELNVHPSLKGQSQIADKVVRTIKATDYLSSLTRSLSSESNAVSGFRSAVRRISSLFR